MKNGYQLPLKIRILRWTARIWSLILFIMALVIVFSPNPYATGEPIPLSEYVLLGLWGASIAGLLLAWRWEKLGALIAIATMVLRELVFIVVRGRWYVNFLMIWLVILPPAVMFLLAWRMKRNYQVA